MLKLVHEKRAGDEIHLNLSQRSRKKEQAGKGNLMSSNLFIAPEKKTAEVSVWGGRYYSPCGDLNLFTQSV